MADGTGQVSLTTAAGSSNQQILSAFKPIPLSQAGNLHTLDIA